MQIMRTRTAEGTPRSPENPKDDQILGRIGLERVDSSSLVDQSRRKQAAKWGEILRFLIKNLSKSTILLLLKKKTSAKVTKCVA